MSFIGPTIILIVMGGLNVLAVRAARYEYTVNHEAVHIRAIWYWGLIRRRKRIRLDRIRIIRKLGSTAELIPLVSGFPQLWGHFARSRMVVIQTVGLPFARIMITPDRPDDFIAEVQRQLSERNR